uniref:Uncharacterized protein n=1 Tax=Megaviridae environmental sample TaxID=1737588 RepID=A0A5J6VJR9_9VIRU|nr:MAG: hypothetical protein [Megaviridae environmental sample]
MTLFFILIILFSINLYIHNNKKTYSLYDQHYNQPLEITKYNKQQIENTYTLYTINEISI